FQAEYGIRSFHVTGVQTCALPILEQLARGADVGTWARGKKALVVGAGSMSSLAAATLARAGVTEIVVANRTSERAERLAQILTEGDETGVRARAVPMGSVPFELPRADIVLSCTRATRLGLTAEPDAPAGGTTLPPASPGAEENCPLDLSAVQPGFSVMGEAAVAGMDAATLEQHAAWAAGGAVERREGRRGVEADAELIGALAA